MNIWVCTFGFEGEENVENLLITYQVERLWMIDNSIDVCTVMMYMYADVL
jgi:PGF-pre-PGF domain-containing protein